MSQAVRQLLAQLYRGMIELDGPVSDMVPEKDQRNQEIFVRYIHGERGVNLARVRDFRSPRESTYSSVSRSWERLCWRRVKMKWR